MTKIMPPLVTAVEKVINRSNAEIQERISTTFVEYAQGIGSHVLRRIGYVDNATSKLSPHTDIMVHPNTLPAIKRLLPYDKPLSYTIPQQAEAIQSSLGNDHVLVVMPTGSGKSLAFFAAPLLLPAKMFVLITPLIALTNDMSRRLAATGIQGGKWSNHLDPFTSQLVIVSAHQAGTTDFCLWAKLNLSRIHRFFIDEAHHIFTSDDYRNCFRLFGMLTELGKPITFLTATIFPHSVPHLCERMSIDRSLLLEIRAPTVRPNIKITMTQCTDFGSMMVAVKTLVRSIDLGEQDRGLVFCTSIANCKTIAKLLDVDYYIAKIKEDEEENQAERSRLHNQFRQGILPRDRWMVATLCFGQGVDIPGVRWVIHVEVRCLMNYGQEIGRAGRDGELAYATTFYTHLPYLTDRSTPGDHEGVSFMIECLRTKRCRWLSIGRLDISMHSCAAIGAAWCDNCEVMSKVRLFFPLSDIFSDPCSPQEPLGTVKHQMCFDLDTQTKSMIPRSISVQSNAHKLQEERSSGHAQLQVLQTLLDSITNVGCVDCWFREEQVESGTLPHTHQHNSSFAALESAIRSKRIESPKHWPFCYLCWVPFHAPCLHPPYVRNGVAKPDRCTHIGVLPRLVNLIWHDPHKCQRMALLMGEDRVFSKFATFLNWLVTPSSTADEIPGPHRLVIAYYREYRAITCN